MKRKLGFLAVLLCAIVAASIGCSSEDNAYPERYTAMYGSWFALPAADAIAVKDTSGAAVKTDNGMLFVESEAGYTLVITQNGKTYNVPLDVIGSAEPMITPEKSVLYGSVGELLPTCGATATDGVRNIEVTSEWLFGNDAVENPQEFVPSTAGTYTLRFTATADGKTAVKDVDCYIENGEESYSNKISSFDKPYGVKQVSNKFGRLTYTDEIRFDNEAGSLGVEISTHANGINCEFALENLNDADVTKYDAVYFYAYNGNRESRMLYINWGKAFVLRPGAWTRCQITRDEYEAVLKNSGYFNVKNKLTLENINGLMFVVTHDPRTQFLQRGEKIHFSAMRGINYVSAERVQTLLDKPNKSTLECDTVNFLYGGLSEQERATLHGHDEFMAEWYKRLCRDSVETVVKDKVFYFDEDAGAYQVENKWSTNITIGEIDDEKVLCLKKGAGFDMAITLTQPYIYDLSDYDLLEMRVYADTDRNDLILFNSAADYKSLGVRADYALKPKTWNTLLMPVGTNTDATDAVLWFRPDSWTAADMTEGSKIYLSAVIGKQWKQVYDKTKDISLYSDAELKALDNVYASMTSERRAEYANDYVAIGTEMTRRALSEGGSQAVVDFSSATVAETIASYDGVLDRNYTTVSYSAERKYGNEVGSTAITCISSEGKDNGEKESATVDIKLGDVVSVPFAPADSELKLYIYYEGDHSYTVHFDAKTWGSSALVTLQSGTWTEVTIHITEPTRLTDYMLWINSDWGRYVGDVFYLSALTISIPQS